MKKPLRGRRSGPRWFLILLLMAGGGYAVWTYVAFQATALKTPALAINITPIATPMPRPSDTPASVATSTSTPARDFKQLIIDFRRAERAVLQTLDANVLDQVPVFAHGEALDAIEQTVETLRTAGQYQVLIIEDVQVEQITQGATIGVLVNERFNRQTFARAAGGDLLVEQETGSRSVVYGVVQDDGRWKVDKVRVIDSP